MLKTANSSENLLTSVGIAKKDKVIDGGGSNGANKNLPKSQKPKILIILSNVGLNTKTTRFLISEASATFI